MSLISAYVDQDDLGGGRFRNVIALRPIAVREAGVLRAMIQDFADGDASFPHTVERAPLRVRRANDGGGRMYPVPGDDTKYIELGPPKVQIGGTFQTVSLGTPSRSGNVLTWTRPQTLTTFTFGGHFADLRIELLGGFVPENNLVAFPVAIGGLTRQGLNIQNNGVTVARLRPFQMIDAANPFDRRPITQAFVNIGGAPHLRLTLPSLAGMTRPVIDPTLELQPDATAGKDTDIETTSNNGTATSLDSIVTSSDSERRALLQFDLSSLDPTVNVSLAELAMTCRANSPAGQVNAHRITADWEENEAHWTRRTSLALWASAGGDFDASVYGSVAPGGGYVSGTVYTFTITTLAVEWIAGTYSNYGVLLKRSAIVTSTGLPSQSSDNATPGLRPKLTVTYTEAAAGGKAKYFMHYARLRQ